MEKIEYSMYDKGIDTEILYDEETTTLKHKLSDIDGGDEEIVFTLPVDKVLTMVQDALDIIDGADGWRDLPWNCLIAFNVNSLVAWNNAMVEAGIIPNRERESVFND